MDKSKYRRLLDSARKSADYWLALTRIEFVSDVQRIMAASGGVTQRELADNLNTSQPYVSKILNGATNFTLKTMIKIARGLGAVLHVRLTRPGEIVQVVAATEVVFSDGFLSDALSSREVRSAELFLESNASYTEYGRTPRDIWLAGGRVASSPLANIELTVN